MSGQIKSCDTGMEEVEALEDKRGFVQERFILEEDER
jgi:hypothetical protein